ncbi:MAG: hypothetical protein K2N51_00150 [Lachnospiraceae bacterium]|nr:hypothetical protein [Lachnospiraceae bacterium]
MDNNVDFRLERIKKWCNNIKTKIQVDLNGLNNLSQLNIGTDLTKSFKCISTPFQKFNELYEKAEAEPNSVINHLKYEKTLEGFYWAWPYCITGEKIKNILEKCQAENDFDKEMQKYFSRQRMQNIFKDTYNGLPRHHRMLFKQVEHSYWRRDYAIANNALMSIIDNLLKKYMFHSGNIRRKGIMEPMTNYYGRFTPKEVPFYLRMEMLSHCINFIFQRYDFSNTIHIETNKKANRHIAVHGLKYSNKRIDTILLINTIYEILYHQKYMKPFEGTIKIYGTPQKAEFAVEKTDLFEKRIKSSGIIN